MLHLYMPFVGFSKWITSRRFGTLGDMAKFGPPVFLIICAVLQFFIFGFNFFYYKI